MTHVFTIVGDTSGRISKGQGDVTKATIYVRMLDLAEREYSQFHVMNDARTIIQDYPDCAPRYRMYRPFREQASGK